MCINCLFDFRRGDGVGNYIRISNEKDPSGETAFPRRD